MTIAREEIFGPVQSILKFDDIQDAIKRANATPYGLASGLITKDVNIIFAFANQIKAGTVWVNTYLPVFPQLEFGGYKQVCFLFLTLIMVFIFILEWFWKRRRV